MLGELVESTHFRELLKATKHLAATLSPPRAKTKCFISYAWEKRERNAMLQAKLIKV